MTSPVWLRVHLLAAAALAAVGWTVQLVVYPAFAMVGPQEWQRHHARHTRVITAVVGLPWLVQGVSTAALLVDPPAGRRSVAVVLALLALAPVVVTLAAAVPAHGRLTDGHARVAVELPGLLRANLARSLAWTAGAVLAAVDLAG